LEKVLAAWGAGFSLPGRGVSPNPGRGQPPSALPLLAWGHIGFFRPQKNSGWLISFAPFGSVWD